MTFTELIRNECDALLKNDIILTYEDRNHTFLLGKITIAAPMSLEEALAFIDWSEEEMNESVGGEWWDYDDINMVCSPSDAIEAYLYNRDLIDLKFISNEALARLIRDADEWNITLCYELCDRAGVEDECIEGHDDDGVYVFESVLYAAAEKLGVTIY